MPYTCLHLLALINLILPPQFSSAHMADKGISLTLVPCLDDSPLPCSGPLCQSTSFLSPNQYPSSQVHWKAELPDNSL